MAEAESLNEHISGLRVPYRDAQRESQEEAFP